MSARPAAAAPRLLRLAHLLHLDPASADQLAADLAELPADDVRVLTDLVGEALHGRVRHRFVGIAALAGKLPGPVAASFAEKFLPPRLAARVAENLQPAQAAALVGRIPVGYLAELAVALDPTSSARVVAAIPPPQVVAVALELFRRGQHVTMAELAGAVSREGLRAAVDAASARDLLLCLPHAEWTADLDAVVDALPDARVDELLREVARDGLWAEAESLLTSVDPAVVDRVVHRAAVLDEALVDRFRGAGEGGLLGPASQGLLHRALEVRGQR